MNAITKNNWLSIGNELRNALIICLIGTIITFVCVINWGLKDLIFILCAAISSIAMTIPLTAQNKDLDCQWERFSLTLPITRRDIVKGHFMFFTQITVIISVFILLILLVSAVVTRYLNFGTPTNTDDILMFMSMAWSFGMVGQSIMYMLSLMGKDCTSQMLHGVVALIALIPFLIPFYFMDISKFTTYIIPFFITIGLMIVFTVVAYNVSLKLIDKKEF